MEPEQCRPQYKLMNEAQIQTIHKTTLKILEDIGVKISNDNGVEILKNVGCKVENDNIVKIPSSLVEEAIKSAPSKIDIYNREGELAMSLEGRNNYYGLGTDLIYTYDLETGETRESLLKDVANAAIISDYCENIDFLASFALPHDVPTNTIQMKQPMNICLILFLCDSRSEH